MLNTKNLNGLLSCYRYDAVLMATFAENIKPGTNAMIPYFTDLFTKDDLMVKFMPSFLVEQLDGGLVMNGFYSFMYKENGEQVKVKARYTFVIENDLIITQHSSVVPKS